MAAERALFLKNMQDLKQSTGVANASQDMDLGGQVLTSRTGTRDSREKVPHIPRLGTSTTPSC